MLIKELLIWGHESLLLTSDSARLDSELLLAYVLKKPTTFLLSHNDSEVGFWKLWRYKRLIERRKKGEPVAYLIGHKEFFCLELVVNRHVLVPRPDTEILVDCVIQYLRSHISDLRSMVLLDVGTGSGCIPIAVCKNVEGVRAIAVDISRQALRVARKNVKKNQLKSRITLLRSDLLKNVDLKNLSSKGRSTSGGKKFEIIVTANLPYIPTDFQVNPELTYEPSIALYGGDDGTDVYRKLIDQIKTLKPRAIFFELFEEQIAILKIHLPDYRLKYVENMSGKARVLVMEKE